MKPVALVGALPDVKLSVTLVWVDLKGAGSVLPLASMLGTGMDPSNARTKSTPSAVWKRSKRTSMKLFARVRIIHWQRRFVEYGLAAVEPSVRSCPSDVASSVTMPEHVFGVGAGVGAEVGAAVGAGVGEGVGAAVGARVKMQDG